MDGINGSAYPSQNLYVQPPSRTMLEEAKSNLAPRGRSRNPLLDSVSLSQLDRPTSAMDNNTSGMKNVPYYVCPILADPLPSTAV